MNKKILIGFLIFAIVCIISIDIYAIYQMNKTNKTKENKNNSTPVQNESDEIELVVTCHKEQNNILNEEVGINYKATEDYAFYVTKSKEMLPREYIIILGFNNPSEMNAYYDYAINDLKLTVSSRFVLTKNEDDLTLSYKMGIIQGGYKNYGIEYQEWLKNAKYICEETEIVSS